MPTHKVEIPSDLERYVTRGVKDGRFSNVDEAVAEGLRVLERGERDEELKLALLRDAAKQGLESSERGEVLRFDSDEDFRSYLQNMAHEVHEETKAKRGA